MHAFRLLSCVIGSLAQNLRRATANTAAHLEYKNCTFDRWLKICENHTLGHINQMKRNYQEWNKRNP